MDEEKAKDSKDERFYEPRNWDKKITVEEPPGQTGNTYCGQCGHIVYEGDNFCTKCGAEAKR